MNKVETNVPKVSKLINSNFKTQGQNQAESGTALGKFYATDEESSWRREQFHTNLEEIFKRCFELAKERNFQYTILSPNDPFLNFKNQDLALFLKKNHVNLDQITLAVLDQITGKHARMYNLILTNEKLYLSNTLKDTLEDLINYTAILLSHLQISGDVERDEKVYLAKNLDNFRYENDKLTGENEKLKEENRLLLSKLNRLQGEDKVPEVQRKPLARAKRNGK